MPQESEMQANTDALRDYYKKIMHEKDALLRNKDFSETSGGVIVAVLCL